jgi:hypothetical protein
MRIAGLVLGFISIVSSLPASADDSRRKDLNLGVSYGYQGLALRKLVNQDNAIFLGVDYGKGTSESRSLYSSSTSLSNSNTDGYSFTTGIRHYLSSETLSSFIELELGYYHTNGSSNYSGSSSTSSGHSSMAIIGYGLEYYLDAHFSIEARAGLGYSYTTSKYSSSTSQGDSTSKTYSLPTIGIALTRYW